MQSSADHRYFFHIRPKCLIQESKFKEIHSAVSELQQTDEETRLLIEPSLGVPRTDNMHLEYKFCFDVPTINSIKHGEFKNFWRNFI